MPHEYEKEKIKYPENNYTKINSKNQITFNYPLEMKEIYFFDKKINKITLNSK